MTQSNDPYHLFVYAHYFWPSIGGVETYVRLIAEQFSADKEFTTTVVTQTPQGSPDPQWMFSLHRRVRIFRLLRLIHTADVVLIAGPAIAPMLFAILNRKPFIVEHHGYQAICPNGLLLNKYRGGVCAEAFRNKQYGECIRCTRVQRGALRGFTQLSLTFFRRWLCRRAYAHVAISHHVRKRHDLKEMKIIYYGIPQAAPVHGMGRVDLMPARKVHFAYVGRLVEEKGLPLLLAAAVKLKSRGVCHRLSFIGDGPLRHVLREQTQAAGLNGEVCITGFLEGPALQYAVAEVDVVVMPSIWEETAGLSAIEHMMRGRAVLAADIGGLGEVVGDGGVKFRPGDLEDLVDRMTALTNHQFRSAVGARGRARAARLFQIDRMIHDYRELFLEACRSTK